MGLGAMGSKNERCQGKKKSVCVKFMTETPLGFLFRESKAANCLTGVRTEEV